MSLPRAGLGVLGVLRLADDGPKGDDRRDCHDPKHIHAPLLHLRHTRPADDRYFDPIAGHLLETCLWAEGAWRRPRMDHASAGRTMYGEICLCPVWCPPHDDVMHLARPGGVRPDGQPEATGSWRAAQRTVGFLRRKLAPARAGAPRPPALGPRPCRRRVRVEREGRGRARRMEARAAPADAPALPVELSGGFRGIAAPRRWRRPRGPP